MPGTPDPTLAVVRNRGVEVAGCDRVRNWTSRTVLFREHVESEHFRLEYVAVLTVLDNVGQIAGNHHSFQGNTFAVMGCPVDEDHCGALGDDLVYRSSGFEQSDLVHGHIHESIGTGYGDKIFMRGTENLNHGALEDPVAVFDLIVVRHPGTGEEFFESLVFSAFIATAASRLVPVFLFLIY